MSKTVILPEDEFESFDSETEIPQTQSNLQTLSPLDQAYIELGKAFYEGRYEEPTPELLVYFEKITKLKNEPSASEKIVFENIEPFKNPALPKHKPQRSRRTAIIPDTIVEEKELASDDDDFDIDSLINRQVSTTADVFAEFESRPVDPFITCPRCGNRNPSDYRFCEKCGQKL